MADEFRVHRDVDELLRLLGNASGGGGDAGGYTKEAFVEELNKDRTPFVSTQVMGSAIVCLSFPPSLDQKNKHFFSIFVVKFISRQSLSHVDRLCK